MGDHEEEVEQEVQTKTTFGFPILDLIQNVNMKNIPLSSLLVFYGKSTKDLDTFSFEFGILWRSYNYLHNAQKLKVFPATLEDVSIRWFMGLGEYNKRTWEEMKNVFLKKYQDYCRSKMPIMKFLKCTNMRKKV